MKKVLTTLASVVALLAISMTMFALPTFAAETEILHETYDSKATSLKHMYKIVPCKNAYNSSLNGKDSVQVGPMDNVAAADKMVLSPNTDGDYDTNRYITGCCIYKLEAPSGKKFATMNVEFTGRCIDNVDSSELANPGAAQIEFGYNYTGVVNKYNDPFNRDDMWAYGEGVDTDDYKIAFYTDPHISDHWGFDESDSQGIGKFSLTKAAKDKEVIYLVVRLSSYFDTWASIDTLTVKATFTDSAPTEGWNAAKTMFYKNGKAVTGVQAISGKYYYFNSKGVLNTSVTGFTKVSNSYYYFNKGVAYTNRVLHVGKRYLYFGADGRYATTTTKYLKSAGKYYYIYKGVALQNRVYLAGGKLRYFGANGALMTSATGCTKVGNDYYFLYKGTAYTNRVLRVGKRYLYFGADGKYATTTTKYLKSAGKYYYIYKGVAIQNRVYLAGGKIRYFGADGAFDTTVNGFKKVNNKFYFFAKGIAYTNKVEYANKQYRYFATNGAFASTKTGLINIGTNSYYLYKGIALQNRAVNVSVGGKTYLVISKKDGTLYKGVKFSFGGVYYYADKNGYCTKI